MGVRGVHVFLPSPRAGQGDRMSSGASRINRADVAAVCVAALSAPQAANVTLEASAACAAAEGLRVSFASCMWVATRLCPNRGGMGWAGEAFSSR